MQVLAVLFTFVATALAQRISIGAPVVHQSMTAGAPTSISVLKPVSLLRALPSFMLTVNTGDIECLHGDWYRYPHSPLQPVALRRRLGANGYGSVLRLLQPTTRRWLPWSSLAKFHRHHSREYSDWPRRSERSACKPHWGECERSVQQSEVVAAVVALGLTEDRLLIDFLFASDYRRDLPCSLKSATSL